MNESTSGAQELREPQGESMAALCGRCGTIYSAAGSKPGMCTCGRQLILVPAKLVVAGAAPNSPVGPAWIASAKSRPNKASRPSDVRRWVGDASIGGRSVRRTVDSACYVIAGVVALIAVAAGVTEGSTLLLAPVIGIGGIAYGIKIFATRTPYWVSTAVYLVAAFAVFYVFSALNGTV